MTSQDAPVLKTLTGRPVFQRSSVTFLPDPEPRPIFCPIISVDDHVIEPPTLFDGRVPRAMADAAPHVEFDSDDVPFWRIGDMSVPVTVVDGACGRPISEWVTAPQKFDEFRRGAVNSVDRLPDMDLNGVWASVNFAATVWGFAGSRFLRITDEDVRLRSVQAYNDWMIEEWCGAAPDRYIGCQLPCLWDPEIAAQEIRRNAERGFKSVSFSENPTGQGLPSIHTRHWDPFLQACEETDTVINLHVGSSGTITMPSPDSPVEVASSLFPLNGIAAAVDWIYSRIPLRFPNIKIVLSEAGVSWVPMVQERLHRAYNQLDKAESWLPSDPHPVEVLRRNFWYASIEDPSAFHQLDVIGDDRVMIEVDYPHCDSSWPNSQALAERQMGHLPADQVRKLCYGNAAALYRHPEPPAEFLARSAVGA